MPLLPLFDKVSVISDLHMGGTHGAQIFRQSDLLAAYIKHLAADGSKRSALVINGDMVDFLPAHNKMYFDRENAIRKLEDIVTEFSAVWDALRAFVKKKDRTLVVTLGNHDLELALPWVRDHFIDTLTDGNDALRARVITSFDGTGFVCKVGDGEILCLHGNEVDTWNVTDYEALRRIACDELQGRRRDEWTPNAGTKLVIDVMNEIKDTYAFIDLLKPETQAAVRIAAVINPRYAGKLRQISAVGSRLFWDSLRRGIGFLGGESVESDVRALGYDGAAQVVSPNVARLIDEAEERFQKGEDPVNLAGMNQGQMLGWWDAIESALTFRPRHEIAYEAVKELAGDGTFDIRTPDATFERIDVTWLVRWNGGTGAACTSTQARGPR